jgi:hypothetical protein
VYGRSDPSSITGPKWMGSTIHFLKNFRERFWKYPLLTFVYDTSIGIMKLDLLTCIRVLVNRLDFNSRLKVDPFWVKGESANKVFVYLKPEVA